jgi:hypothetical protein
MAKDPFDGLPKYEDTPFFIRWITRPVIRFVEGLGVTIPEGFKDAWTYTYGKGSGPPVRLSVLIERGIDESLPSPTTKTPEGPDDPKQEATLVELQDRFLKGQLLGVGGPIKRGDVDDLLDRLNVNGNAKSLHIWAKNQFAKPPGLSTLRRWITGWQNSKAPPE